MNARLIGLYSPAPQSGKTTVANYLLAKGWYSVPFAAPIKRMVVQLLNEIGLSEDNALRLVNTDKEEIIPALRTTARHLMQTLGTEYGRQCVHPQVWLMCWERAVTAKLEAGIPVVVDDCRFHNEAALVRRLGGELWRIERPGTERSTTHASEGGLDDYPLFDRRLVNDGSLLTLHERVREIVTPLSLAS